MKTVPILKFLQLPIRVLRIVLTGMRAKNWLWSEVGEALIDAFKAHPGIDALLKKHEKAVIDGKMAPSAAARVLLETFLGKET